MSARTTLPHVGRNVYGLGAIIFGLTNLISGDFAIYWHPVPPETPHRIALAYAAGLVMFLCGLAIQWRPSARAGLIILALFYCIPGWLWLRRVIGFPQIIGTWSGFAEQFALIVAAVAAYILLSDLSRKKSALL